MKTEINAKLAEWLVKMRVNKGVSQDTLAELVGKDQPTISRLEGGSQRITVEDFFIILKVLGYPMSTVADDLDEILDA